MIRLNNTPNEGSTVKVNLGFRDSAGQYYIPTKIQYTLLALNNDKESWSIVDDIYLKPLVPASSVVLTISNTQTIEGTTLTRKVMVYWEAFVDNEYNTFVDEINFDIAPKPFVPDAPVNPPIPPLDIYVEINSASLQVGTISAAPVLPVFILRTNLPVNIDNAVCRITGGDLVVPCNITTDSTNSILTISIEQSLNYISSYKLELEGLVSNVNGYVMKQPFVLDFVTTQEYIPPYIPAVEDNKEVTVTENGMVIIEADENYDAMKQVTLNVDLPIQQSKIFEITENGRHELEPDSEFVALDHAIVDVMVPAGGKPEQSKEVTITENGEQRILPDTGYSLSSVNLNVEVPVPRVETGKTANVVSNGTMEIRPDTGYDAMDKINLLITVPGAKEEQEKSVTITENGTTSVLPDENKALSKVDIEVAVPLPKVEGNKTESINVKQYVQPVEILPTSGKDVMEKATVTLTDIPVIEANRNQTIDVSSYEEPVEILPDYGKDGMAKTTVTLSHIPVIEANKTETLTSNGVHNIIPTTGNNAMERATVTVAVPIESGKTQTIDHNGTTTITPSVGYAGLEDVSVTVAVPIETGRTETYEHNGTYTVSPSTGNVAIDGVEVTVDVPLETNKTETISVEDYTNPVEITPTTDNDGMKKATVTLTNLTRMYVWKDANATPNPHYMYTTYSDTSKCDGHAYQCGTVKNALMAQKNVEVNGDALYVSGYPSSLYYRDSSNDIEH